MKTRIKWVEGVSFVGEAGSGHAVVIDGAPESGGRNLGMRPMEMVLTGAAACTAFDVVFILRKGRQPVADVVVTAEAERAPEEPKVFTRHSPRLHGRRPRPRPQAGRARGQAVEGEVLLGHDHARQDGGNHLRDRPDRRRQHSRSALTARDVSALGGRFTAGR